jgi:hypothetical protein
LTWAAQAGQVRAIIDVLPDSYLISVILGTHESVTRGTDSAGHGPAEKSPLAAPPVASQ